MKKIIGIILMLVLFTTCSLSYASEVSSKYDKPKTADYGMWKIKKYVDEFNMPTSKEYITNTFLITGEFSNSATNNSDLTVRILVDNNNIAIELYEYGNFQVKTYRTLGEEYIVNVLDSDGNKHRFKGTMYSDRIVIDNRYENELLEVLANEDQTIISVTNERYSVNKYLFTIEDTSGFRDAYRDLTGTSLISWHQRIDVEVSNRERAKEREKEAEIYKDIIGQAVGFGSYEQDGNLDNGKESIEWIILKVEDGKVYLISRYALDNRVYNSREKSNWGKSELRSWLNSTFYNNAFSEDDKNMLSPMKVYAFSERVTVPGADETNQYDIDVLLCSPTLYVMKNNPGNITIDGYCTWLLRNTNTEQEVGVITGDGNNEYRDQDNIYAIRPVICIENIQMLEKMIIIQGVG